MLSSRIFLLQHLLPLLLLLLNLHLRHILPAFSSFHLLQQTQPELLLLIQVKSLLLFLSLQLVILVDLVFHELIDLVISILYRWDYFVAFEDFGAFVGRAEVGNCFSEC